jgi:hypothetical protein
MSENALDGDFRRDILNPTIHGQYRDAVPFALGMVNSADLTLCQTHAF